MTKATKGTASTDKAAAKKAGTKAAAKSTKAASTAKQSAKKKRPEAIAAAPQYAVPADKFLAQQQTALLKEREEHLESAEALKAQADALAADMEPGDTQFDEESGEGDATAMERETGLVLSAQARAAVDDIDRALAKIDAGTYGICEGCHKPIPKERLKALPYASLCVACKSGGLSARRPR